MNYEDEVELILHEQCPVANTQKVTLKCPAWFPPETAKEILLDALTDHRTAASKIGKENK